MPQTVNKTARLLRRIAAEASLATNLLSFTAHRCESRHYYAGIPRNDDNLTGTNDHCRQK